jgi:hypothetical protein
VLQINGGLPEQYSVTLSMICGLPSAAVSCTGQADLAIQDAANTTTTAATSTSGVATGQQVVLRVGAILDANGNVTTGAMPYTIGVNGIQQAAAKRGSAAAPDPIGSKVGLAVQVGDIQVNVTGGTMANGGWCGGVVPGGSGLPVAISWTLQSGFNASVQWNIEDTNHSPVGSSPFSFSVASGSGTGSISETITNPTSTPVNTLTRYFLAATISNGTATATKYFPMFIDGSTGQNFCGAVAGARGRSVVQGTWSRGAADSLGPITGVTLSSANQKPASAAGAADVHLVASDISFTPSIPKSGDTLLVRFRARNDGAGDAVHVPIGLVINGSVVAIDAFDIPAGHSALGGLSWTVPALAVETTATATPRPRARRGMTEADAATVRGGFGGLTQLQGALVVDPNHVTQQATTADKTAAVARLNVRGAGESASAAPATGQRVLLELEDGACAGLRLTTGGMSPCGNADLEITIADLGKSQLGLDTMAGVSDVGSTFEAAAGRGASYNEQASGLAGHTYSVRLANGGTALVNIESVRNPAELDAKTRALFRANAVRIMRNLADSSGAAAPGDLTGVDSRATVFITLSVKQN